MVSQIRLPQNNRPSHHTQDVTFQHETFGCSEFSEMRVVVVVVRSECSIHRKKPDISIAMINATSVLPRPEGGLLSLPFPHLPCLPVANTPKEVGEKTLADPRQVRPVADQAAEENETVH